MKTKVIIVGAGPVGLLLGNLLGRNNVPTLILEKELDEKKWSRAIGITPPSLEIFREIGLDKKFVRNGIRGYKAIFKNTYFKLGSIKIKNLPSLYPFILSISQFTTEKFLEENLKKYDCIKLFRGYEVEDMEYDEPWILIKCQNKKDSKKYVFFSEIVCACDGEKSIVRKLIGVPFLGSYYKPTFIMGDYHDVSEYKDNAVLWFTEKGSVESFPLPYKQRRWIIQTPEFIKSPKIGYLEKIVYQRTGFRLNLRDKISENSFGVQHFLAKRYYKRKIFLCGDAAHTMAPIGGQGMNSGFADAEFLSYIITAYINDSRLNFKFLAIQYEYYRKRAAKSATFRADLGMRIGTARGWIFSYLRSILLFLILHSTIVQLLVPFFTMINIPYNRITRVLEKKNLKKCALNKGKDNNYS